MNEVEVLDISREAVFTLIKVVSPGPVGCPVYQV